MYAALHGLLGDRKGGAVFTCFGMWHICYILFAFLVIAAVLIRVRKKGAAAGRKAADVFIDVAFGLYVLDFFLMPFAYGEIDIEKLPFHVCTAMCVMCFLSGRLDFLKPYRMRFALLGFLSNLVYLIYPAGVMWYAVHPLCYRVVQTLLFHAAMTAHGFFAIAFGEEELKWRTCRKELPTLVLMTLWAILGNALYNGQWGDRTRVFNWFFVVRDPFGLLDPAVAPYVMPFVNVAIFFAAEMIIYAVYIAIRKRGLAKDGGVKTREGV